MEPGDVVARRFTLEALAGRGAMGAVWRALDLETGARVALKVLDGTPSRSLAERLKREATVLASLSHPAVVQHVAHGLTEAGSPFLAMTWLEGEDLAARLARGPLTVGETVALLRASASGLAAIHARGVVHRDVKPSNLFLRGSDPARATVLDFGIARWDEVMYAMTRTGVLVGTPGYMSPEQARGERDLTPAVDVYALGCVGFECLTGRPPYTAATTSALLLASLGPPPPRARALRPEVPAELDDLVASLMARDPAERPLDGADVLARLHAIELPTLEAPSFTGAERVLLAVVATRDGPSARALEALCAARGQRCREVEGLTLASLVDEGEAVDRALAVALEAALISRAHPAARVGVAMGAGAPSAPGEVAARALALARGEGAGLALDETVTALVAGRSLELHEALDDALRRAPDEAPFTGRERELRTLSAAWDACVGDERSCAVLVTGPAGVGKTRLVRAWLEALSRSDPRPRVLARWARAPGDARGFQRPLGYLSALRTEEGEALPITEHTRELDAAGRLAEACERGPTVLIFDELSSADGPSLEAISGALSASRDLTVMAIGLARPQIHKTFPRLWVEHGREELRLGALSRRAADRLARAWRGDDEARAQRAVSLSGGEPFVLGELLRAEGEGLPGSALAVWLARLGELPPEERLVLRAASVFGVTFRVEQVGSLVGARVSSLEACLDALSRRGLLWRGGDETWTFVPAIVREACYASLTEDDRRAALRGRSV